MYWWYWLCLIFTGSRQKALLADADRLLRRGRPQQALNYYYAVMRDWPDLPDAYACLVKAYMSMGLAKEAQIMERITQAKFQQLESPITAQLRLATAKDLITIKLYGPALLEAENALRLDSEDVEILRVASMANRYVKNYKRANYLIQQALLRDTLNVALYEQMALILRAVNADGDFRLITAIISYLRKVEAQPDDVNSLENLMLLFSQAGYKPLGLELVERCLRSFPNHSGLLLIKARILMDEGEAEKALPTLQTLVQLEPTSHRVHILLARAYYQLSRFQDSQKHQELASALMAIERIKDPAEAKLQMIKFLLHCGHVDRARVQAEKMMLLSATNWQSPFALGLVLLAEHKNKEALESFIKSTVLNSKVSDAYLEMAKLYARVGNEDKTVIAIRHATAANPRDSELRRTAARILRQAGKSDLAAEEEAMAFALANQRLGAYD